MPGHTVDAIDPAESMVASTLDNLDKAAGLRTWLESVGAMSMPWMPSRAHTMSSWVLASGAGRIWPERALSETARASKPGGHLTSQPGANRHAVE